MAAPPKCRPGQPAESAGRPVIPGVASFGRVLSPRASIADLWSSIDALAADPTNLRKRGATELKGPDARRFSAFVAQAKQYYAAIPLTDPVAKPLLGYYFALNLSKAYLTAVSPDSTRSKLRHGLSPVPVEKQKYRIEQEKIRVWPHGVFRSLAESTGQGYCWNAGEELQLVRLFRYLPEAVDLYADAYGKASRLIPVADAKVLFGKVDGRQSAWLRIEISRATLRERKLSATRLLAEAGAFEQRYRLVADASVATYSYESIEAFAYGKKRAEVLPQIRKTFDESLFGIRRYSGGDLFVVHNERANLLSQEAVTFAVLHHLSDMVRYRPHVVEQLRGSRHYWIFSSWVDRACENFLLAMASRITQEEHVIR